MKIAIIGAGAVGGWYGGRLLQAGHSVTFVARGETLDALRTEGITLNDETIHPVTAVGSVSELADADDIDVVVLCVKVTPQTDLDALLDLPAGVPVALTQNSVETPEVVVARLGFERTWPGVVRGFFHHTGPARVEFHGGPITYEFGRYDGQDSPVAREFAAALTEAGIGATVVADPRAAVWEKAMQVSPTGALGLIFGTGLGQLRTTYRASLLDFMRELDRVAVAAGIDNPGMVERTIAFCDTLPETATTSMQRDETDHLPSELDAQVGAIVRAGEATGTATPLHRLALALVRRC